MALCLFEARKTQLEISDLSKPGVYKGVYIRPSHIQGGFQMLVDSKRLSHLAGIVPSYSPMLREKMG